MSRPDSAKRDRDIQHAMETIEEDYDGLKGVLPKGDYSELNNDVLGQLLRTLNPEELKQASGDIFGRIYEYFLTQFADLKAHDNGEFFTPVTIENFLWDDRAGLPTPAYSEEDVKTKSRDVYRHIHRVYPTITSPFYMS